MLQATFMSAGPSGPQVPVAARRSWRSRLLLLLLSTAVTLAALELGFRAYDFCFQGLPFWWDPAAMAKKRTEICNPLLLFRGAGQDWTTRCKTPEQVIDPRGRKVVRIVCLGGSTTQDVTAFLEDNVTYPSELQRLLNERLGAGSEVVVEVINAGFASHSTLHMLVLLESELWQLKPDLVIAFENVNDLTANYFPGPTTPAYANKFLHNYYLPPELHRQEATLLDHSRCYTWACERLRRVIWYRLHYKETDEPIELKYAETYRANLRNICAVARAQGARVMLGTQAMAATQELFETQFKTKSYNADIVYPRVGQFREHFEAYNAIAREVAAEQKALFADPYTALKDRPELFIDVVHTRAGGARLVAREFADKLIASGWLDDLAKAKRRDTTPVAAQ